MAADRLRRLAQHPQERPPHPFAVGKAGLYGNFVHRMAAVADQFAGGLDPQLLDAWLAFWGAVKTAEAINQAHDHSYGEYRTIMGDALRLLAQEEGWEDFDSGLAAIGLSALLDGLWLECGLNPSTFTPAQGVQICEAWVDGVQMGGYRRFIGP